jgi:uncharacterized protein YndB with AHSA1/START domain
MVTVGYERIIGMRARGQRMDGSWEVSKSRTFAVPVAELFDAWADARKRRRWLDQPGIKVRTATPPRSLRLQFPDGTIVAVWFLDKGERKSVAGVQHTKLADRDTAERMRAFWQARLEALSDAIPARRTKR